MSQDYEVVVEKDEKTGVETSRVVFKDKPKKSSKEETSRSDE
jgi:hypothetical protein